MADPRIALLLAMADDELITGHRLSEWTGWVPYIEEDLALSSIAQDEIAHGRAMYELAVALGAGTDADALAFGRAPRDYRCAVVCERPNGDFAYTLARHWLYENADDVRTAALLDSSYKELVEALRVFRLEERYHLDHARTWFTRLAEGPVEARTRIATALSQVLPEALSLFEPLAGEEVLLADGVMPRSNDSLLAEWLARVAADLEAAGLEHVLENAGDVHVGELVPTSSGAAEVTESQPLRVPGIERRDGVWVHTGGFAGAGGRLGTRSDDFAALYEDMTGLYRGHPGATW